MAFTTINATFEEYPKNGHDDDTEGNDDPNLGSGGNGSTGGQTSGSKERGTNEGAGSI